MSNLLLLTQKLIDVFGRRNYSCVNADLAAHLLPSTEVLQSFNMDYDCLMTLDLHQVGRETLTGE